MIEYHVITETYRSIFGNDTRHGSRLGAFFIYWIMTMLQALKTIPSANAWIKK